MEDDSSLVRRTVEGDSAAFGLLYDRYAPIVRALAYDVTHDMNLAQDLAQDVFLRAYGKLSTVRNGERFGPWLIAVARHCVQEWRRSRLRDRHRFSAEPMEVISDPENRAEESVTALRLAIAQLPERERLALHLHYLQEQPIAVAQRVLGLSYSAFYKILARARERLARILSNEQEAIP
ncbi:RNA polymerase sigma factor [Schlesneria paludicola]|uniref:RNA polymerase sigma factor n=1 Tax=Schlesneria paludicola TaxID=360056 RepID=UPI00029A1D54|nr:RNA polymerase sigma factor [Schlesneria paludicola]